MPANYPDLLGEITGGVRANVNVLQLATALRPFIARAGRPFEMLMLLQNASDVALDVTVTLSLPDKDNKGKKKRFVTKAQRLVISLPEAGVGVVTLPVSTMPDTAIGDDYKIGMEVKVQPVEKTKPQRIRLPEGGAEIDLELLDDERQQAIADLKKLRWSAHQPALRKNVIESICTVMSGKAGSFADLQPSWQSLWTLSDHTDDRLMFIRFRGIIETKLLPSLAQRRNIFTAIQETTQKRFSDVGYPVNALEVNFISRLLTLILEYASMAERDPRYLVGEDLNLRRYLEEGYLNDSDNPVYVPFWVRSFLKALAIREDIADTPLQAIMHFAYDDLLKDAMLHTFMRLETVLDVEVGTNEERLAYADNLLTLMSEQGFDLNSLFMPLVFGGMIVGDGVLLKGEKPNDVLDMLRKLLDARLPEQDDYTAETLLMARRLVEISNNRYSGRNWN
jgi:hypothetical protein